MTKRRKTSSGSRYQVPSLQSLALAAVRRNEGRHFRHNTRSPQHFLRRLGIMDDNMTGSTTTGSTQTDAAKQGAKQVGQGLQVTVPRNIPHAYNNNFTVRLTYSDCVNVTFTGAGGYAYKTFSMNSVYDPDVTGTGHQPHMRDLWASQYDYYAVLSTSYHVEAYNCSDDAIGWTTVGTNLAKVSGCTMTLLPTTSTTDISNAANGTQLAVEMKNTRTQWLLPNRSVTFEGTLTPGDFIVDAKDQDSDNTWTAVGSNPGVQRYLGIVFNSNNTGAFGGATETPYTNIQLWYTFDYDVQFTQVNASLRGVAS